MCACVCTHAGARMCVCVSVRSCMCAFGAKPRMSWSQGLPTGDQRHSREFPTANRSGLAESQLRGVLALAPNQSTGHVLTEAYSWGA